MGEAGQNPEAVLRAEIRTQRNRQGMTAQQLADQVAESGGKLSRQAISKIETGDRGVSLDELLVLARALGVPPILLLFPVGTRETVEPLPGMVVYTDDAMQWFTGERPGPGAEDWQRRAAPVLLWRQHARQVSEYFNARDEVRRWDRLAPSDDLDTEIRLRVVRERVEDDLRTTRAEMRRHGLTPPKLPAELEHLEKPTERGEHGQK